VIRVLQFADRINRFDFIDTIVRWADPRRFVVGVCVRDGVSNIVDPGYGEGVPKWVLNGAARREVPRAAVQLAGVLKRWRADVVHAHHYDQAVIGWLATRLYPKARLIVGRHYSDSIYRSSSGIKRRALLAIEQAVNRAASRIVVPSTLIRDILTLRQGIDPRKVEVIYYGFNPEKYTRIDPAEVARLRRELGMEGHFVIGNISRLHEEKGHRFLFEALAGLRGRRPDLRLLLVGEGPERPALEQRVRELGLGDVVRFLGFRHDAIPLMAAVDAVVQPTLQEAFSQVMVEALWLGKPLVITDVSGATDILRDGDNGLLVPRGDVAALAAAIGRVAADRELRLRLSERGQEFVRKNLAIEGLVRRYEACYEHVLTG
jgi:glycosyltransferase involved in cell wall biosynthesis